MENQELNLEDQEPSLETRRPALPFVVLLALASALGVAVAITLAGVTMLLAAPAYAGDARAIGESSLLLERQGAMAEAERLSAEVESREDGDAVVTRVVEVYHNPFGEALSGFYLYRLPPNVVLERLSFAPEAAEVRHAVLTRREAGAVLEPTEELGPGETLVVVLQYRTRAARRVLAARAAFP